MRSGAWAGAALGIGLAWVGAGWVSGASASDGWETRESGLKLRDVTVGSGDIAELGSTVEVHYTGALTNGTVFDSSIPRGQPFSFRIGGGRVIKGWEEGVQGMRVGGKRQLVIPPHLGYGSQSTGSIPANATLHFEVELLGVDAPVGVPAEPASVAEKAFRTTRSGLSWADVERGRGNKPKDGQLVCVTYGAWTVGGERVDDTRAKGECWTFRFQHDKVIAGLQEGVRTMREGGVRQLLVPPDLLAGKGPNKELDLEEPVLFELRLVKAQR